jgi:CheY-like chemotaxis protein
MMQDYHFLYVEDDPTSRMVMEMMLTHWFSNTQLTIFEDSSEFTLRLEMLLPKPDIIFLDIHMKPYTGFEMLEMIRSHREYANSVVIALTASVMNEEVEELEAAGFDGAIAKPLNREMFPQLVMKILQGESVWHVT